MKLNSDILLESLSQQFTVECKGVSHKAMSLNPPLFFKQGMEYGNNEVYIAKVEELSPPPRGVSCLIVCLGNAPAKWDYETLCMFSITGNSNIEDVFNVVQATYARYGQWSTTLREILDTTASLAEMIREAACIFKNPITLLNNRLEIEVAVDSKGEIDIARLGPIPENRIPSFISRHKKNTSKTEPFLYEMKDEAGGHFAYCINIFKQGAYLGQLSMKDVDHSFSKADLALFDYFYGFISKAVEKQLNNSGRQFASLKSIFCDLINGLPVGVVQSQVALHSAAKDTAWLCIAIKPIDTTNLPLDYLCALLEQYFPQSSALPKSPYVALYLPVQKNGNDEETYSQKLEGIAENISFRAGVSFTFENVLDAHHYFCQAVNALEMTILGESTEVLHYFRDYALPYALKNSVGELSSEFMIPPGLLFLKKSEDRPGGTDYWKTLKVYLDNEMNITLTARDLFIHRTTLRVRLEKIRKAVDLSTPLSRMYIRYCLYLYEVFNLLEE